LVPYTTLFRSLTFEHGCLTIRRTRSTIESPCLTSRAHVQLSFATSPYPSLTSHTTTSSHSGDILVATRFIRFAAHMLGICLIITVCFFVLLSFCIVHISCLLD